MVNYLLAFCLQIYNYFCKRKRKNQLFPLLLFSLSIIFGCAEYTFARKICIFAHLIVHLQGNNKMICYPQKIRMQL